MDKSLLELFEWSLWDLATRTLLCQAVGRGGMYETFLPRDKAISMQTLSSYGKEVSKASSPGRLVYVVSIWV